MDLIVLFTRPQNAAFYDAVFHFALTSTTTLSSRARGGPGLAATPRSLIVDGREPQKLAVSGQTFLFSVLLLFFLLHLIIRLL